METRIRILLTMAILALAHQATAQTRELLDAPQVKDRIRVQWDATNKKMTWAVDEGTRFRELLPDALFLTKTSVVITYPRLNPLRIQATASVTAADDPSAATISKLIESILSVATILRPGQKATGDEPTTVPACPGGGPAANEVGALTLALYGPDTSPTHLRAEMTRWTAAIDDGLRDTASGAKAIRSAITLITQKEVSGDNQKAGLLPTLDQVIKGATASAERIEKAAMEPPTSCDGTIYRLALLTNPRGRIQQLAVLKAAVTQLVDLLETQYAVDAKWEGTDFHISDEIRPTPDKMRNVTVKIANVTLKVDDLSSALTIAQEDAGSAAFTVRRYNAFAPEIGVGAVFGFVTRPKYGTGKNQAGDTIVARVPDDQVSVDPSVLVNFVCRCAAGAFAPMVQIGASTSKDLPAILVGGGLRLFGAGKGDVAIGGGLMLAWVKDLQTLKEGDVVTGTKDIEADLGYGARPRPRGYFGIQYKF